MKKLSSLLVLTTLLFSSTTFAFGTDMMSDSSCGAIVKACKAAGFARSSEDKRFWKDCMQPVLLGKSVKGVTVSADQVKACRDEKINKMQKELKNLQEVK